MPEDIRAKKRLPGLHRPQLRRTGDAPQLTSARSCLICLCRTSFENLLTMGDTIALATQLYHLTAVSQTVKQGGDEDRIAENFRPSTEAFV